GNGEFELNRSGDLWRLLATITVKKTLKRVEFEHTKKRDYRLEESSANSQQQELGIQGAVYAVFDDEPSPDQVAILVEELAALMNKLSERDRQILELRLQEMSYEEIAETVNISESTVRRVLRQARDDLFRNLMQESS
ncbi:MAG: sigma-70 family RNA polymerase sigma factor, partial [Planctomycetaceae bacterium]|nr:sigma-70 family RNA polymerase sigma factor [Planctomycetaceae bacterium]